MYCTHCGEKNPAGSTRCAACGSPLAPLPGPGAPVGRRCPMCGTVNSADAAFCAQCAARVVPMEDLREEDLDVLRPAAPEPPKLSPAAQIALNYERQRELFTTGEDRPLDPDLARRLTAPPEPPPRSFFGTHPARSADAPLSWLDALRNDTDQPAPAEAALPAPAAPAPPPPPAPATAEPTLPAWLNAAPPAPPAAREEATLPAWLSVAPAPAEAKPAGEAPTLPAWLTAPAPAPPTPPAAREEPTLPAWLTAPAPAPPAPAAAQEAPTLPAWLSDLSMAPAGPPPATPAEAAEASPLVASPPPAAPEGAVPPWLRGATVLPAPPPPAAPEGAVPPWLSGTAASAAAESVAAPVDELPAWLSPAAPAAESAAPAGALPARQNAPADGLPAWLSAATPAAAETVAGALPSEPGAATLGDIELPAWLRAVAAAPPPPAPLQGRRPITGKLLPLEAELAAAGAPGGAPDPPGAPPPTAAGAGDGGLPAWMHEPAAAAPAVLEPAPAMSPVGDEGLPAGTDGPPAPAGAPVVFAPVAPQAAGDVGLPVWMSGPVAVPAEPTPALPVPPADATAPAAASAALAAASAAPAAGAATAPAAPDGTLLQADDLPAWLRAIRTTPAPVAALPEAPPVPQPVTSPDEEIPAWLRALGHVDDELAAGAALDAASGPPVAAARIIHARPPRAGAVAVFERLLAAPPDPVAAPAARRSMLSRLFTDRLVHLLLLAVVVGMWVLAPQALDLTSVTAPQTAEGAVFYDTLSKLPANKPVLLVYDWDATRYGEMHPLSVAVTRVLSATGHALATISTLPEGTGFALQVTAEVLPGAPQSVNCGRVKQDASPWPDAYGTRYLHLGYLPGNEAGLAQLATTNLAEVQPFDLVCNYGMRRAPLLKIAPTVQQFGAIVLLAGGDLPLRLWIEQVASHVSTPVLAALPESLRPAAAPYLNLDRGNARLRAAVFGVAGAQETVQRLDAAPGAGPAGDADRATLGRVMHTESAALFFLALALLVGFIAGTFRWINRRSAS